MTKGFVQLFAAKLGKVDGAHGVLGDRSVEYKPRELLLLLWYGYY